MNDKIETYAFSIILIQLSFVLIGLAGIFPFSLNIAGFDVYGDIQNTISNIQTMYESIAGSGALSSIAITGYILIMGVKILLEFFLLTIIGAYPVLVAVGLPVVFALPISVFIGAVCVYQIAIKFLGR
jgi:hypothetical protein